MNRVFHNHRRLASVITPFPNYITYRNHIGSSRLKLYLCPIVNKKFMKTVPHIIYFDI